jgi:hypothetical protein
MDGCTRADARGRAHQIPWLQEREGRRGVAWRETASATLTESTSGTEIPEATQILFALFPRQCAGAGAPATMGGRLSSLPATFSPHLSSLPAMLRLWMTMRVLPKWIRSAEAGAARLIPYIRVKEACVCYRHVDPIRRGWSCAIPYIRVKQALRSIPIPLPDCIRVVLNE